MHLRKLLSHHTIAGLACLAIVAGPAHALSLGDVEGPAYIGRPLSITVPVRLGPGETLEAGCVQAAVRVGDVPLSAGQVSTEVAGSGAGMARVTVRTFADVNEPVVDMELALTCSGRVSRRYVLFADPPDLPSMPPRLARQAPATVTAVPAAPVPAPQAAVTPRSAQPAAPERASRPTRPAPATAAPTAPPSPAQARPAPPTPRQAPPPAAAQARVATPAPRPAPASPPPSAAARTPAAAPAAVAPGGPRLRLDPLEFAGSAAPRLRSETRLAVPPSEAPTPQREAAKALWDALNAGPDVQLQNADRLLELERRLLRLQAEADEARRSVAALEVRVQQAQADRYSNPLVYGLFALLLLALVALWWMWRERRRQEQRWWDDVEAAAVASQSLGARPSGVIVSSTRGAFPSSGPGSLRDFAASRAGAVEVVNFEPLDEPAPAATAASARPTWAMPTQPQRLAQTGMGAAAATDRHVTVEELFDLEQQAEFFLALDQVDAAIHLLETHVRSDMASSPFPYLKLMELYRKADQRDEHERVRAAFNQRFNSYAPAWEEPAGEGRSLEDYDMAIDRLCKVWNSPRVLDVLESSLLRRDGADTFDLPAYRELMLLYTMAREKMAGGLGDVDLLLPDGAGSVYADTDAQPLLATTRMPAYDGPEPAQGQVDVVLDLADPQPTDTAWRDSAPGDPDASTRPLAFQRTGPYSGSIDFDPLDLEPPPSTRADAHLDDDARPRDDEDTKP